MAVDAQPRMLSALRRRAEKAGLAGRIDARLGSGRSMGIDDLRERVDFVLAFAVVHELPDQGAFFAEASAALKPGGRLLLAEPAFEVSERDFEETVREGGRHGLRIEAVPAIRWSRSALLRKGLHAA